jgi:hypothetical protein
MISNEMKYTYNTRCRCFLSFVHPGATARASSLYGCAGSHVSFLRTIAEMGKMICHVWIMPWQVFAKDEEIPGP